MENISKKLLKKYIFKETVISVKTGIHSYSGLLDSYFRSNDTIRSISTAC